MRTVMAVLCLVSLGVVGCVGKNPQQDVNNAKLTSGVVKKEIVKGVTNQADVLAMLGSPNIITSKDGCEVWAYDRICTEQNTAASGLSIFGYGMVSNGKTAGLGSGATGFEKSRHRTSTRTFTLVMTFDKSDVISDYTLTETRF